MFFFWLRFQVNVSVKYILLKTPHLGRQSESNGLKKTLSQARLLHSEAVGLVEGALIYN